MQKSCSLTSRLDGFKSGPLGRPLGGPLAGGDLDFDFHLGL
jgi:hypothetical protein